MALIKCPECDKDISDKVKACPHCGYPLEEIKPQQLDSIDDNVISPVISLPQKNIKKIVIPIIITLVISIVIYFFTVIVPQKKYNEAISMLEIGNYKEGQIQLEQLGDYKDSITILEQTKYESIAYACINDLKKCLKNPDSYIPYEFKFYITESKEDTLTPGCVMYYGAQNGFGGNTTSYALFAYSKDKETYEIIGTIDSLDKDDLDERDKSYSSDVLVLAIINIYHDKGTEVGSINMSRLKAVLKNDAYSTIKMID